MSQRAATITSLPVAYEVVKAMQADSLDWSEGFRPLGRQAIAEIVEQQMAAAIDDYIDRLEADDAADRRNGYYRRHLLTELGDIELNVPRTRRYSPVDVIRAYARRTPELDRVILSAFVLGLSTRKVGETLLSILGRPVSATTVSQVAKTLDTAVAAFHRRPLANRYKVLMLDGCRFWWLWGCAPTARRVKLLPSVTLPAKQTYRFDHTKKFRTVVGSCCARDVTPPYGVFF